MPKGGGWEVGTLGYDEGGGGGGGGGVKTEMKDEGGKEEGLVSM